MSASHQREAAIFDAAMDLAPERRSAYLDEACAGDTALRQRVEALLKAGESQCLFLDSPARATTDAPTVVLPVSEKPGDAIGRYKLLEQIGEGGCGVVYVAEQTAPVRRRVALKIIKLGMDTRSVIARFEAERQALAMMDHPNIAKVFDAGATETGRPYFVMELVRGMKITEYCDQAKLSTRARLDLFVHVCQAIQHAHQKGIIHRDIKPSNILVTVNDGVPVPKVIDFGIAKATSGQQLTDKTIYTAFEQFIGTPAYMSPEQAVLTSLDIDTRSDIYALGVLLYELLTGQTPFDAKELLVIGLDEMRRTIREQEPPRPSTRVSTLPGQELSTTAQRRGLDALKLVSELRGDLDWIVMKALEKDRARRYDTANGLASDIQRHLNNEPVVARPPNRLYRLQKTVRRNKLAFTAAAAVVAALVSGLGISTWLFLREREVRTRALAAEQAERKLRQQGELRELNEHAFRLSSPVVNLEPAIAARRKALEVQRRLLGHEHPDVADSLEQLERLFRMRKNLSEAEKAGREALAIRRKNSPTGDLRAAESLQKLAGVLADESKWTESEELLREAVKIRRRVQGDENVETAGAINDLAVSIERQKKRAAALPLYREAFAICRKLLPDGDPNLALVGRNLILTLIDADQLAEATDLVRDFVPRNRRVEPNLSEQVARLARHLSNQGKSQEAEQILNDLVSKAPESRGLLDVHAQFLARQGRFDAALTDYRRLVEMKPDWDDYWRKTAVLLVFTNQRSDYHEHCRRYLERFSGSADLKLTERTAKACLLLPGTSENTRSAIELAERLNAERLKDPWIACVKGLAEYRRGTFQAALDYLQHASEVYQRSDCEAQTSAIAAMAHYQLKQLDKARSALNRANDLASDGRERLKKGNEDSWDDWLRAFVLIREASALIEGNSSTELETQ